MLTNSVKVLKTLQYENGMFAAARKGVKTGYNRIWIRDNIYASLGLEATGDASVIRVYRGILDILLKHEFKIDYAIAEKPKFAFQYIHPRYDPDNLTEIYEEWGNKQNDAIGAFLFKVADLMDQGYKVLRDENDLRILQKLVYYLKKIEYWHDTDNGIWEENEEVHASSVGACLAGLKAISKYVKVPYELIDKGQRMLTILLPRESVMKEVDMALLSLIYPYNVVTDDQKRRILAAVEEKLVRSRGVIRYVGDQYYNRGGEAEWTMGLPWLAKIYKDMGNHNMFQHYLKKTYSAMNQNGELPELYFSGSNQHNDNTPLAWSQAMLLVALS